jgi:hypothetical protein
MKLKINFCLGTIVIMSSLFPNLGTNIKSKPKWEFRTKIQNNCQNYKITYILKNSNLSTFPKTYILLFHFSNLKAKQFCMKIEIFAYSTIFEYTKQLYNLIWKLNTGTFIFLIHIRKEIRNFTMAEFIFKTDDQKKIEF